MFYALWNEDDYMATGLNKTSKEETINDGIDFFAADATPAVRKKLSKMSIEDKELHLVAAFSVTVDESKEPFIEAEDEE